jgi:hypothetical protein
MKGMFARLFQLMVLFFLPVCVSVESVEADIRPGPVPPPTNPLYYLIIFAAEFLGFLAGIQVLSRLCRTRWQKGATTVMIALVTSYIIGITVWTSGQMAGIPVYNPLVISTNLENKPQLPGLIVTLLPEFLGTIIGGFIVRTKQDVKWATAILTMVALMLTSWILGSLMINLCIVR